MGRPARCERVSLQWAGPGEVSDAVARHEGATLASELKRDDDRVVVCLREPVSVPAGTQLDIELRGR